MKIHINVAIAILIGLPAFAQKGIDARLHHRRRVCMP